ncbi:hypothetical protein NEMIN01_0722 [Nematocida minor]|uniref:uncharacterized protein n=1 Tax=Nematocida minor TaxID=1912983 RepID=UPI00221E59F5|nr:uncharacterized protein NEMIN01_0722 [Nematocida minor]KAI5189859.1 hypothetical protein NEMIN01_0722 [Nematocida minor]
MKSIRQCTVVALWAFLVLTGAVMGQKKRRQSKNSKSASSGKNLFEVDIENKLNSDVLLGIDKILHPSKPKEIGKDIVALRVSGEEGPVNEVIEKLRDVKKADIVLTYITDLKNILENIPTTNSSEKSVNSRIKNIVEMRAVCMLSNKILIPSLADKQMLTSLCGVPEDKIVIIKPVKKMIKNTTSATIKNATVPNGLYVLYANANIHINVEVKNNAFEKIYVRAVKEEPFFIVKNILCKKGPYERRMYEAFAEVSKNDVNLSITETDIFSAHNRNLVVSSGGVKVSINPRNMSVTVTAKKYSLKNAGLIRGFNKKRWQLKESYNKFNVNHPLLRHKKGDVTVYLYNMPRRFTNEMFDPHLKASPLKRVLVTGWFASSGFGVVSKEFLLELATNQKLILRSTAFDMYALRNPSDITGLIVQTYLLESDQTNSHNAINVPGKFSTPGVEVRNRFPVDLSKVRPGYNKIFLHFPWEFSLIPSAWIDPIKESPVIDVIVPSIFAKNIHMESGIQRERIHVVPHGVAYTSLHTMRSLEEKQKNISIAKLFDCPSNYIRFVMIGGALKRKGLDTGIKAYINAFKGNEKVVLRIHAAYGDGNVFDDIKEILHKNKMENGPKIVYTQSYLSDKKIRALLSLAHYNIAPFKGEGFGLNILEGNAMGAIPIVTKARPATEFCDTKNSFFIKCKKAKFNCPPVMTSNNGKISMFGLSLPDYPKWYEPSEAHLATLLKKAYAVAQTKEYKQMRANTIKSASKQTWSSQLMILENLVLGEKK